MSSIISLKITNMISSSQAVILIPTVATHETPCGPDNDDDRVL